MKGSRRALFCALVAAASLLILISPADASLRGSSTDGRRDLQEQVSTTMNDCQYMVRSDGWLLPLGAGRPGPVFLAHRPPNLASLAPTVESRPPMQTTQRAGHPLGGCPLLPLLPRRLRPGWWPRVLLLLLPHRPVRRPRHRRPRPEARGPTTARYRRCRRRRPKGTARVSPHMHVVC